MSGILLEVDGLEAGYEAPVVGPMSFAVEAGETVGLTGPNGAGKSTILGALVGAARVFAGTIWKQPGMRMEIQLQRPVRLKEMPLTGREYLKLCGVRGGDPGDLPGDLLGKRLDALSAGQFQLLTVLACLEGSADLVLLDEPDNNMDGPALGVMERRLAAGRRGRGVVIVSHDAGFLGRAASRVVEIVP